MSPLTALIIPIVLCAFMGFVSGGWVAMPLTSWIRRERSIPSGWAYGGVLVLCFAVLISLHEGWNSDSRLLLKITLISWAVGSLLLVLEELWGYRRHLLQKFKR